MNLAAKAWKLNHTAIVIRKCIVLENCMYIDMMEVTLLNLRSSYATSSPILLLIDVRNGSKSDICRDFNELMKQDLCEIRNWSHRWRFDRSLN